MTYTTDYAVYDACDDPPTDWSQTGDMPVKTNQDGSVPQFYIEGTGCVETQLGAEKSGYITHTETVNLTDKALVIYNWVTGPGELAVLEYWTNRVYQSANYVDYDLLPELLTLATGGWLPYVLWPTPDATQAHITNSGTPTVSGITDVEVRGSNSGTTINIKVMGFDIVGSIGYMGAHSQTVTIDQLAQESADNYYGVITVKGSGVKTFQVQSMIQYGGTGTTTVNESNKTITFRGANPDHPVGYEFLSGGTTTDITWTDMVFNWEFPQPPFEFTGTPTTFKLNGCALVGAADVQMPAHSTARWCKNTKFNDCQTVYPEDMIFENNIMSNQVSAAGSLAALELETTSHRMADNSFINNSYGIEISTPGTYVLDGDTFSGNGADILNNSGGEVIIQAQNGANPTTYVNVAGGPTEIQNSATLTLTNIATSGDSRVTNGESSEVRIYQTGTQTELAGQENITDSGDGSGSFPWTYNATTVPNVDIVVHHTEFEYFRIDDFEPAATSQSLPVAQQYDRNYNNPV